MSEGQIKQTKNIGQKSNKNGKSPNNNFLNSGGTTNIGGGINTYNENQNFTNNTLSSNRSHRSLEKGEFNQIQPF